MTSDPLNSYVARIKRELYLTQTSASQAEIHRMDEQRRRIEAERELKAAHRTIVRLDNERLSLEREIAKMKDAARVKKEKHAKVLSSSSR